MDFGLLAFVIFAGVGLWGPGYFSRLLLFLLLLLTLRLFLLRLLLGYVDSIVF